MLYSSPHTHPNAPQVRGVSTNHPMETDIEQLKDEVSSLAAWVEQREEQLRVALARQADLARMLAVRSLAPEDLEIERKKEMMMLQERDSLRESRQVLEAKKSLLYTLESQLKYRTASQPHSP
jgi:hypothetical protein